MARRSPVASKAMRDNACGDCSLCCTLMAVHEIDKPCDVACAHIVEKRGCAIYDKRPRSCANFACVWLQDQKNHRGVMRRELRPDRCHVVMFGVGNGNIEAVCDPKYPGAWKVGAIYEFLRQASNRGVNILVHERSGSRVMANA